jgi:Notch 1
MILLFSLLFPSTILACNLNCFHGASCEAGVASFHLHPTKSNGKALDMHIETSRNGYHCNCPPGYTGLLCGIKYIDCEDSNHMCYNGGKCILGLKDMYGNDQLYCDCSEAIDKNGVSYVGKYCEIPKSQTCDESGEVFCVNGGWCKVDFKKYPRRPCHCGTEHEGPHCEFEKGTVPDCTLKCHNKGICRRGMKKDSSSDGKIDYDFWKAHSNYQYCACPEGYHGLQCEIHSTKCGSHDCFNGGDCVTITTGTRHEHYCDCTKAHANNVAYGGQFCQYEADNLCESHTKINGQQFCLNNGECHQSGSEIECKCPEGFHGPICEFEDSPTPNLYENCTLQCENDGKCQNGAKDNSIMNQFGSELSAYTVAYDHNFEHCVCPEGFMGLKCETKVEICGNGQHVCLHGSKCVADGYDFSCNCDVASTPTVAMAGEYCQHISTSICSTDEVSSSMSNQSTFAFCVNNGQCVDIVGEDNLE